MKKHLFWIATLAFGIVACTDKDIAPEDNNQPTPAPEETLATQEMSHVELTAIPSDQSRVTNFVGTRADEEELAPGTLKLIAEIKNPDKTILSNYVDSEGEQTGDKRYLSATCVYYDAKKDIYYATYHMQGNNYNTQLDSDVKGLIETFRIDENGKVTGEKIYRSADPNNLDFDFNHLYFDDLQEYGGVSQHVTEDRLIAVGHLWKPGKTEGYTQAIIAKLNLEGTPTFDYKVVYTGEKIIDETTGKSLGPVDAQDVNAVVRSYDTYYLATRKGIALVDGIDDNLFNPVLDEAGKTYFIKTPGSVKHVSHTKSQHSELSFLYLTADFPDNFNYDDKLSAKLIGFHAYNIDGRNGRLGTGNSGNEYRILNIEQQGNDFLNYLSDYGPNVDFDRPVSPIDGKNVLLQYDGRYYAALGKAGLFCQTSSYGKLTNQWIECGNRPVNGVAVNEGVTGDKHAGHIYIANGSKISIFNREALDEVASWNLPNTADGSANYVVVRNAAEANQDGSYDRIITVAFGQEGVKVFRFRPKPLW